MAGMLAGPIIEGTYTVVGGTAARYGITEGVVSAFGAVARNARSIASWAGNLLGIGGAAYAALPKGTSGAPTPLGGAGGGGSGGGGGGGLVPSSGGSGLPVPRGNNLPAISTRSTSPAVSVKTIPTAFGKGAGKAIVVNNGLEKTPNIIPMESGPLATPIAIPLATATAAATMGSIRQELQDKPLLTIGIALGIAAIAVAGYGAFKR